MRTIMSSKQRQWAARLLIGVYALCAITPATAVVLSGGATAAHCLSDDNSRLGTTHVHEDGSSHQHSVPGNNHDQPRECCGLFSLSAIAASTDFVAAPHDQTSLLAIAIERTLSGRVSDRIDRPPRSLPSV
jgi:hypothetical protein